jgi:protein-S-isoprenylcysteine O-methyltransferase Ste14
MVSTGTAAALVILGWGIHDLGSFFVSAPRTAFLAIMIVAMACATVIAPNPTKKGNRTPSGQQLVLASVQVVTLPLLVFLPYADRRGLLIIPTEALRWFGLGSAIVGYAIMLIALRALGKDYSVYVTIQEQHQLVQTGIYKVVRNPIYLGTMLSWPGACLVFRSWLVFPIFLYFCFLAVLRGMQEERILREQFNAEFEVYRQRTWSLVPYVY